MLTEEKIKVFLIEYTRGVDLINCINFAIENDFNKPEDFEDFGCNIDFITEEKSSVKDMESLSEWNVVHHNTYVKRKIAKDESEGFSFPPPYNFITEDDIGIVNLTDLEADVEVNNANGTYLLKIEVDESSEHGMIISSIHMKLPWGDTVVTIFE